MAIRDPARRGGFTLIELLIVISVLGILASMLLPVLARVREVARRSKCLNNLRQIGYTLDIYADEHRSRIPDINYSVSGWTPWNWFLQINGRLTGLGSFYPSYLDDGHVLYCPGPDYPQYSGHDLSPSQFPGYNHASLGMTWSHFLRYLCRSGANTRCNYFYRHRWATNGVLGDYSPSQRGLGLSPLIEELSTRAAVFDNCLGLDFPAMAPHENAGYNILYYDGTARWMSNPDRHRFPTRFSGWGATREYREDFLEFADRLR